MSNKKKFANNFRKNVLYAAVIGGILLTSVYYFLTTTIVPSDAATPKINLSISPATARYPIIQTNYSTAVLQTGSSSQKISGFSLVFVSTGPIVFSDISAPVAVGGSPLQATLVRKVVNVQEIQVDYAFIGPATSLPKAVSMKIYYSGALKTTGKISLNSSRSQVVGNIVGNTYQWGKLGYGTYSFY